VLQSLDSVPTARAACAAAGVEDSGLPAFRAALAALAASAMIEPKAAP
jgi:hypothetical protein